MYKINFNSPIKIHFIGIGGISMSGLAEILLQEGFTIVGSDIKESSITKRLEELGVKIYYTQEASNIEDDLNLVVYTAAIKEDNLEFAEARIKQIPLMDRATLLGQIMSNYKNAISVSGTHGKTTTTSMITQVLLTGGQDPTVSVGGILDAIGGNIRVGNSDTFITEACEYCNSFLKFTQRFSIILNVEEDHMDFFKDIHEIRASFKAFAHNLPANGALIINSDIEDISYFTNGLNAKVITYGEDPNKSTYSATNITFNEQGHGIYDLIFEGNVIDHIELNVIGLHNIYNSLSAIAIGRELNIPMEAIKEGLNNFSGTNRRFQYKGTIGGVTVIDDYAHHPTEITATLKAAANIPHERVWLVFQPHTYTRTKAFLDDFATALSLSDNIILTDIYAAREKNTCDIHSKDLVAKLGNLGKHAQYFPSFSDIENFLLLNCTQGDLLITMGAGDVNTIGEKLLGI